MIKTALAVAILVSLSVVAPTVKAQEAPRRKEAATKFVSDGEKVSLILKSAAEAYAARQHLSKEEKESFMNEVESGSASPSFHKKQFLKSREFLDGLKKVKEILHM